MSIQIKLDEEIIFHLTEKKVIRSHFTQELTDFRCSSCSLLCYVESLGHSRADFHWFFFWLNPFSEFRGTFLDCFASKFSTFD